MIFMTGFSTDKWIIKRFCFGINFSIQRKTAKFKPITNMNNNL